MKKALLLAPFFILGCAQSSDDSMPRQSAEDLILSPQAVRETVRARALEIRSCYKKLILDREIPGAGRVIFTWTVSPEGQISNLELEEDTFESRDLVECIKKEITTLEFPSTKMERKIRYPFVFKNYRQGLTSSASLNPSKPSPSTNRISPSQAIAKSRALPRRPIIKE